MLALIIGVTIVVLLAMIASKKTVERDGEKIERTKVVSTNPHSTGRMNGSFYIETTFMLYMKDGSKKAVTVKNGTMEYNNYISKLEV